MPLVFLDTSILLRHLLADHAEHSPRATAFLARIERGEFQVRLAETVVFETVFTLQRHYRQPKAAIRDALVPILELPGIVLAGKRRFRRAFDYYVTINLPFADAYHTVLTQHWKLDGVASFDRDFDRIPGITRVEP